MGTEGCCIPKQKTKHSGELKSKCNGLLWSSDFKAELEFFVVEVTGVRVWGFLLVLCSCL